MASPTRRPEMEIIRWKRTIEAVASLRMRAIRLEESERSHDDVVDLENMQPVRVFVVRARH
jgi:hypothetical protein